jgi:hypothetical protein
MFCGCDPMCDVCVGEHLAWHRGVAAVRGENWARAVARVCPVNQPWPTASEKMRAIARRKVNDIATDARLVGLLADE